jgi:hypothetical protein
METKVTHLQFIQNTIGTYDMHGLATKVAALLVTAGVFLAFMMMGESKPALLSLAALGAGAVLFVLWLIDAHYYQHKLAYAKLYDSERTKAETDFNMNVDSLKDSCTTLMWRAPVSWLYVALIGAVAFLSMMS